MRRALPHVLVGLALCAGCGSEVIFPSDGGGGDGGGGDGGAGQAGAGQAGAGQAGSGAGSSGGGSASGGAGGNGASTGAGAQGASGGAEPTSSSSSGGACKSCSDALFGVPGPFCPGSNALFDALVTCGCDDFCAMPCASSCNGGPSSRACNDCVETSCASELDACLAD